MSGRPGSGFGAGRGGGPAPSLARRPPAVSPESGPLTTYSAWCSDSCRPLSKTVERTLVTVTCCEAPLCNVPSWQGPGGGPGAGRGAGPGGPRSCPLAVAANLWLSLLCGLRFLGS